VSDIVWMNVRVQLGEIDPWAHNPRQSGKRQRAALVSTLDEFGQSQPLVIGPREGDKFPLYDGHQRYHAWLATHGAGFEVDARLCSRALSETERQKYVIQHHASTVGVWSADELASWDAGLIESWTNVAQDMKDWKANIGVWDALHKSEQVVADAEPQTDRADALLEQWGCKSGDLWTLGDNRLLIGDCTVAENVSRLMDGQSADLVLTDPPYSVDYAAKNRALQTIGRSNRLTTDIEGDTLSTEETAEQIWRPAFENVFNASRNGTVIYCFSPQGGDQMMMMMMMRAQWNDRLHQLIWRKNAPTFSMGRLDYQYQHEPILYTWRGTNHGYYGETGRSVIDCDRPSASKLHPTMKPVELFELLIRNSSREGEIVLEPFAGSGTTIIAATNLQRRCFAMEISEKYAAVILQRFADAFPHLEIKRIEGV
jgi:DNA modification methylase